MAAKIIKKKEKPRPEFDLFQSLVLENLRKLDMKQDKSNDKLDDLSIRITRLEDGHIDNTKEIQRIEGKIDCHVSEHKTKKNMIRASTISAISSFSVAIGLVFFEKIKIFIVELFR